MLADLTYGLAPFVFKAAALLILGTLHLWIGMRFLARVPRMSFARCFLAMLITVVCVLPCIWYFWHFFSVWMSFLLVSWLVVMGLFRCRAYETFLAFLPLLITTAVVLVSARMYDDGPHEPDRCLMNMKAIGYACAFYQEIHKQVPLDLEVMAKEMGLRPGTITSPNSEAEGPSYFYLPPLGDADPNSILACDYADAHEGQYVHWVQVNDMVFRRKPKEFQRELAKPCNHHFAAALAEAERQLAEGLPAAASQPTSRLAR